MSFQIRWSHLSGMFGILNESDLLVSLVTIPRKVFKEQLPSLSDGDKMVNISTTSLYYRQQLMGKPKAFQPTLTWSDIALLELPFHVEVTLGRVDKRVDADSEYYAIGKVHRKGVEKSQDSTCKGVDFSM